MIENLRYHVDNGKLMINWNIRTPDKNVRMTVRLLKRLNKTLITEVKDINLEKWREHGYGYEMDMPLVPAYIEVKDEIDGSLKEKIINEAPLYRVDYTAKLSGEEGNKKAALSFGFNSQITDEEIKDLPGWMISGLCYDGHEKQIGRFFWPGKLERNNTFPQFKVTDKTRFFTFEVVKEIEGEKEAGLFRTVKEGEEVRTFETQTHEIADIDLGRLNNHDGKTDLYEVHCPFCLRKYRFNEPCFRANISRDSRFGYEPEFDEAYKEFCSEHHAEKMNYMLGKVLTWDSGIVKEYATADNPNEYVRFEKVEKIKDVVISVRYALAGDESGKLHESHRKVCPYCHNDIPLYSGALPMVLISMMGNTGCGKSVYIRRIAGQLDRKRILPGLGLMLDVNNNDASRRMNGKDGILTGEIDETNELEEDEELIDSETDETVPDSSEGDNDPWQPQLDLQGGFFSDEPDVQKEETKKEERQIKTLVDSDDIDFFDSEDDNDDTLPEDQADDNVIIVSDDKAEDKTKHFRVLDATTARAYNEPYVYQLRKKGADGEEGVILALYDFPGECILRDELEESTDWYDEYFEELLKNLDGIIFMFDPMTLKRIKVLGKDKQKKFAKSTYIQSKSISEDMLKEPSEILKRFRNLYFHNVDEIKMPMVFVLPKGDALRDKFHDIMSENESEESMQERLSFLEENTYEASGSRKGVDITQIEENSKKILDFMDDRELNEALSVYAPKNRWICVSSTGIIPEGTNMDGLYGCPVHCAEPIEWLLYCIASNDGEKK